MSRWTPSTSLRRLPALVTGEEMCGITEQIWTCLEGARRRAGNSAIIIVVKLVASDVYEWNQMSTEDSVSEDLILAIVLAIQTTKPWKNLYRSCLQWNLGPWLRCFINWAVMARKLGTDQTVTSTDNCLYFTILLCIVEHWLSSRLILAVTAAKSVHQQNCCQSWGKRLCGLRGCWHRCF